MAITEADLTNWFTHHPPQTEEEIQAYQEIRSAGLQFAHVVVDNTPPSADQTAAIRKIREAVMVANSAIACHQESGR